MNAPVRSSLNPLSPHLPIATVTGVAEAVRGRIARGDDVNATDREGRSPLILAASRGHLEICELLLAAGADPSAIDRDGNSAGALATRNGHPAIAALLREHLAPPDRQESASPGDGHTATAAPWPDPWDDAFTGDWEAEPEPAPPEDDPLLAVRMAAVDPVGVADR